MTDPELIKAIVEVAPKEWLAPHIAQSSDCIRFDIPDADGSVPVRQVYLRLTHSHGDVAGKDVPDWWNAEAIVVMLGEIRRRGWAYSLCAAPECPFTIVLGKGLSINERVHCGDTISRAVAEAFVAVMREQA